MNSGGWFPAVSLALSAALIAGCVVLPVPTPATGSDIVADDAIGAVRPGATTRADVLLALGDPTESEDADRFFAYDWKVSHGAIVWAWAIAPNAGGVGGYRLWAYRCFAVEFGSDNTVVWTGYLHLDSSEANGCLAAWRKKGHGPNDLPQ